MEWLVVAFVLTAGGLIAKVAVGIARWLSTLRALNQLPHPKMGVLGCTALFDQHHVSQVANCAPQLAEAASHSSDGAY